MKKGVFRIPVELTTKKCWIGVFWEMYGGTVVVFSEKPVLGKEDYDVLLDNESKIAAYIRLDDFCNWFGIDYKPKRGVDWNKVEEVELTAIWNEHNVICGFDSWADRF